MSTSPTSDRLNRRHFLKASGAASLAAGAAVLGQPSLGAQTSAAPLDPLLPTIKLGRHDITRLILGGNPIYGHSHFNRILSQAMTTWHTPERVVELLRHCEARGINTWQNSYADRTLSDLDRFREAGGKLNWLCLGKPDWDEHPERIEEAARRKPIGIAPHGSLAERLHRAGKVDVLTGLLKRIRATGALVGLSAHDPAVIELAEEKGWDVDYYMCCLYYLTRPRDELQKLLGPDLPLGEIYLPGDPARMFKVIKGTRKPCLVYKILAAGRRVDSPAQVRQSFETAFNNIKPTDAVIVGMWQQFGDQVGDNAKLVRELGSVRS
jgi:hypothetical protein